MKLLLTSFGRDYRENKLKPGDADVFYGMPPALFAREAAALRPDCSAFILADYVLMDGQSFERLTGSPHPLYADVAAFFTIAKAEGLIVLVDYEAVLQQKKPLLDGMLERDMAELEPWVALTRDSMRIWQQLLSNGARQTMDILSCNTDVQRNFAVHQDTWPVLMPDTAHHMLSAHVMAHVCHFTDMPLHEALNSAKTRRKATVKRQLKGLISSYLAYVNANILLSHHFDAGVCDWADFTPFYNDKFLRVGTQSPAQEPASNGLNKLFSLVFPTVRLEDPKRLVKLMRDKRLIELRSLCRDAASGAVSFDDKFANSVLREVFAIERKVSSIRNKISWLSLPLGFVPVLGNFIQKPIEELIARPLEKRHRNPYNWFFVISDYFDESRDNSPNA